MSWNIMVMMLRRLLFRAYWKAESFILPGTLTTQQAYYHMLLPLVREKVWLDLGCGHAVFWPWMKKEQEDVVGSAAAVFGIDLDWNGLVAHDGIRHKMFGSACDLPLRNESIDVVSANMVVEHLPLPAAVLQEVLRVLKPGGVFIFHTPNVSAWPTCCAAQIPDLIKRPLVRLLDGRDEKDIFKTNYQMNTIPAIRALAENSGFEVHEMSMVSSVAVTAVLGPVAWPELLYLRWVRNAKRAHKRSNIIAVLRKTAAQGSTTAGDFGVKAVAAAAH